jgi:glycosyltransferase involved in cell wall biosynthesis
MEGRYDILHLHGGRDSLVAALSLPLTPGAFRPRVIRTKHNVFPISDHVGNRHLYGRVFELHIALSQAIVDQLAEKPYVARGNIRRIPSAIEPGRFQLPAGTREKMRAEFGFQPDDLVVAMVGRFRPEKGHDILMPAAQLVIRQAPKVRFLLLGAGSQLSEIQLLVAEHQLTDHVLMPGFRTDIPECLSAADLYVQPSRSEGLGTGVLEAAAARLPIVASRVGGIPDIVAHEDMGILVQPEDSLALATGLLDMLEHPERARSMADLLYHHVLSEFSVTTLMERTDAAYREILAMPRES